MKFIEKLAKDEIDLIIREWIEKEGFPYEESSLFEPIYKAAFNKAVELAIDRVQYSRFSIVLRDDDFTKGYLKACEDIKDRIGKPGEEV